MKLNWNFLGGGGEVQNKKTFHGGSMREYFLELHNLENFEAFLYT